ncbi:MAG: hypothetical protein E6K23_11340 [Gammaproteobacteria bacterium]|nr:MAG: hypothetical protein E6K40_11715 [Gammaproteobacteria bacterium]TLZ40079.1 MAG: hypothetical protein E6K23_11340 [Gammaproteobacteria bacterium]
MDNSGTRLMDLSAGRTRAAILKMKVERASGRFARNRWMALGSAFFLYGVIAWLLSEEARRGDWWLHGAWCIGGVGLAAPVLLKTIQKGFGMVLRDHLFMFTGSFALYFLIGASFMTFGPSDEIAGSLRDYYVDAPMGLKTDALNAIGFGIALIVAAISPRGWSYRSAGRIARPASHIRPAVAILWLMVFGLVALLYTLTYDFGFREGVVPGVVRAASYFLFVAIYIGASYRGSWAAAIRVAAVALAVVLAVVGVLLFNKSEILLSLSVLIAGLTMVYRRTLVLTIGILLLGAVYFSVSGLAAYGRNTLGRDLGAPIAMRWDIVQQWLSMNKRGEPRTDSSSWQRLSYVTSQGAAIDFYDAGRGGDELRLIPWLFVPRVIASQKPVITEYGSEFYYKISGQRGSSTGQGIFVSGYYNAGWWGLIVAAAVCGWILAQTSSVALAVLERRALVLLPLALLGVYIAFRIDGHFLGDYLGTFVFFLYFLLLSALLPISMNQPWRHMGKV